MNGIETLKTINPPMRIALYSLGVLGLGLSSAPIFGMAAMTSPSILPTALGLTTAIFGGASLMAYSMPSSKMLGMSRVLMGSLFGLLGLQIVGLLTAYISGPTPFSMLLFDANNYLGVALFSVLIAYDTHVAMKMYEMRQADHLGMSIQFLLDFWNILVRMVAIFTQRRE